MRRSSIWLLPVILALAPGCAGLMQEVVPAAMDAALDHTATPETQKKLKAAMNASSLPEAAQELGRSLAKGIGEGMTADMQDEARHHAVATFVDAVGEAFQKTVGERLAPAARKGVEEAVDAALDRLLSSQVRADASRLSAAVAGAATTALSQSLSSGMSKGLKEEIGPALQQVIAENVAKGLNGILKENRTEAGAFTRNLAREAGNGLADALRGELGKALGEQREAIFGDVDKRADQLERFLWGVLLVSALSLGGVLWWLRNSLEANRRSNEALGLLVASIKQSEEEPGVRHLVGRIKSAAKDTPGGKELDGFLSRNKHLRVDPDGDGPP